MREDLLLTTVDGYDVIVRKGPHLSSETELWVKNGEIEIEISVPSNEYENSSHEFMIKRAIPTQLEGLVEKVIEELASEQLQLSYFKQITVKQEFKEKIYSWLK